MGENGRRRMLRRGLRRRSQWCGLVSSRPGLRVGEDLRRTTTAACCRIVYRTNCKLPGCINVEWAAIRILVRAANPWIFQDPNSCLRNNGILSSQTRPSQNTATGQSSHGIRSRQEISWMDTCRRRRSFTTSNLCSDGRLAQRGGQGRSRAALQSILYAPNLFFAVDGCRLWTKEEIWQKGAST